MTTEFYRPSEQVREIVCEDFISALDGYLSKLMQESGMKDIDLKATSEKINDAIILAERNSHKEFSVTVAEGRTLTIIFIGETVNFYTLSKHVINLV